jgi:hypothetical protein
MAIKNMISLDKFLRAPMHGTPRQSRNCRLRQNLPGDLRCVNHREAMLRQIVVLRFRSSHRFAAIWFANFGIKGALPTYFFWCSFEFEVPMTNLRRA